MTTSKPKHNCSICSSNYTRHATLSNHMKRNHPEVDYTPPKKVAWNKGLCKATDNRLSVMAETFKTRYANGSIKPFIHKHTPESIAKLKQNSGGVRIGAGRGKSGWYNGIWCDSSWELMWVIYNIDHGIQFKRSDVGFRYTYNNTDHTYKPDFILGDGTYIEIKGYMTPVVDVKLESVRSSGYVINLFGVSEMKPIFEYIKRTYGYSGADAAILYTDAHGKANTKQQINCKQCDVLFTQRHKSHIFCSRNCFNVTNPARKVNDKPCADELVALIKLHGFSGVGRMYGVNLNTIKKWCIGYGLPKYIDELLALI